MTIKYDIEISLLYFYPSEYEIREVLGGGIDKHSLMVVKWYGTNKDVKYSIRQCNFKQIVIDTIRLREKL